MTKHEIYGESSDWNDAHRRNVEMAEKKEPIKQEVAMEELISRKFEGIIPEEHDAEINQWLSTWKGDAETLLRNMASQLREKDAEISRLTDHAAHLEDSLQTADAFAQGQQNAISALQSQIEELGKTDGA